MCKEPLERLAEKAQHEKDRAQSKIRDCRKRITEIRKEEAHWEGERDQADFLLFFIQNELKGNGEPDEQPEIKYPEGEE